MMNIPLTSFTCKPQNYSEPLSPKNKPSAKKNYFNQLIERIIFIAGAAGLFAGLFIHSQLVIGLGIFCCSGAVFNHIYKQNEKPSRPDPSSAEPDQSPATTTVPKASRKTIVNPNVEKVIRGSKIGRKITNSREMAEATKPIYLLLKNLTDESLADLMKTIPDKMKNLVENFPEVFAEICNAKQIASLASNLFSPEIDDPGAMAFLLQLKCARIESNEDTASEEFYALLAAFADTGLFHSALENQLKWIKLKIEQRSVQQSARSPGELWEIILKKIQSDLRAKEVEAKRVEIAPISTLREGELIAFAKELISEPNAKHFARRNFLTAMAKHDKKAEITFLVNYLGVENIVKLWVFEAQVDNRANDPTPRLMQMCAALSPEQFNISLQMNAFQHMFVRCPHAALGFAIPQLKLLADSQHCDEGLSALHRLLLIENNNLPQVNEILAAVVARVKVRKEEAHPKTVAAPICLDSLVEGLRATMELTDLGETIDRMTETQLTNFIGRLDNPAKLEIFWEIQKKKIIGTLGEQQKMRLQRIFPKLNNEQLSLSAKTEGFRVVLSNTEEKYLETAVATLTSAQLKIIAADPDMIWTLINLANHFDSKHEDTFSKLLAIAEGVPLASSNPKHAAAYPLLRDSVGKRYVGLAEPIPDWGKYKNRANATKHIDDLLKAKIAVYD